MVNVASVLYNPTNRYRRSTVDERRFNLTRLDRAMFTAVLVIIAFASFYIGAHVMVAAYRGTLLGSHPAPECTVWEDGSAQCTLPPSRWAPEGATLTGCIDNPDAPCRD